MSRIRPLLLIVAAALILGVVTTLAVGDNGNTSHASGPAVPTPTTTLGPVSAGGSAGSAVTLTDQTAATADVTAPTAPVTVRLVVRAPAGSTTPQAAPPAPAPAPAPAPQAAPPAPAPAPAPEEVTPPEIVPVTCPPGQVATQYGTCVPDHPWNTCPSGQVPDESGACVVPVCPPDTLPAEDGSCVPADYWDNPRTPVVIHIPDNLIPDVTTSPTA